jgi:hypothetical protein
METRKAEPNVGFLLTKIQEFRSLAVVSSVRGIANSLKHHADLYIKDLDMQPDYVVESYKGFTSTAVADKPLDIDEAVVLLQGLHSAVIDFSMLLLEFIDFKAPFVGDEEGVIHLDRIRDKTIYKKFFIMP